jgi:solute carrier family 25 (mitochondrial phosphate transporter), member 23/24/25/41
MSEHVASISSRAGTDDHKIVFKNLLAGGIAGAISRTVVSPLERLKILFQVQQKQGNITQGNITQEKLKIKDTLVNIKKKEGWRGFFKGNGTNVIRIIPYSAVQFASFEFFKRILLKNREADLKRGQLTIRERFLAGASAGICSVTCTYPLDLIRTRLSLPNDSKEKTIFGSLRRIYTFEGGISALYRGITPTLMGIAPYVALNFTIYESLKQYSFRIMEKEPSVYLKLGYGALAGATAQTITYPLDVIRRGMQVTKKLNLGYDNTIQAFAIIWKDYGIRGFYRGLVPNLLKVAPAIAVSFVTFEQTKTLLA